MRRRKSEETIFKILMVLSAVTVAGVFFLVLATIFVKGFGFLSLEMLTKTPQGGYYVGGGGGILNAIVGSMVLGFGAIVLAFLVSLPLTLYLNCYCSSGSKFCTVVRFLLDVLWGIPSVVYGAFGFTIMVFFSWKASLLAGTITVALLVIPIMARSMDEILKVIPAQLAEASFALGATRLETAIKVIVPQAFPGIITAVLVAFGRGIGDAASVLFTASFTDSLPGSLSDPVATLPLAIFFQLGTPFPEVQGRGYASAFVLTVLILVVCLLSRFFSKRFDKNIVK